MPLTKYVVGDAVGKLTGAVMIVYPMELPPYDEARLIIDGKEDLDGKQVLFRARHWPSSHHRRL